MKKQTRIRLRRLMCLALAAALLLPIVGCAGNTNPTDPSTSQTPSQTGTEPSGSVVWTEDSQPNTQPTAQQPTGTEPTQAPKPTDPQPTETKPTEPKPTEPEQTKPTEPKPTEPKPTEPKPTEPVRTDLPIVEDGKACATIIIAEKYTQKAYEAAADLQSYLLKMTGVTVKIGLDNVDRTSGNYILVGPTRYTEKLGIRQPTGYPDNEKVIVKRVNNYLVLLGNDDGAFTGTQFAVTMFLETLGCGWFGTRSLWQVVPELDSICINELDITKTPKFISRENRLLERYPDLARRWYMGGVEAQVGEHFLTTLVTRDEFAAHPEWFARRNGEMYMEAGTYWQYCYSNEELAHEIGSRIIAFFDANPNCYIYSITPNDGWVAGTCDCSECEKIANDADLIVRFANRVARKVAQRYPDRRVSFLSYHSTLVAPDQSVTLEPNVEVMFCAETTMTKPITQAGYIGMSGSRTEVAWTDNFKEYVKKTQVKNISVWKWLCIAAESDAWANIPWVQGNVAIEDQNYWKSQGASYVFYDQGPHQAYREYESSMPLRWPLWYVAAKGAWDADLTGDEILLDACQKLYGKAANSMFAYYKALANASEACQTDSYAWAAPKPSSVYTSAQIRKIDDAIAAAKTLLDQVTELQRERMENQIALWEQAKKYIYLN